MSSHVICIAPIDAVANWLVLYPSVGIHSSVVSIG